MAAVRPRFAREKALLKEGHSFIAGVDEVGRGPLAGPVVAAAVILDPKNLPKSPRDSKSMNRDSRDECFAEIASKAVAIAVASASSVEIDRFNIRGATLLAMKRALTGLAIRPCAALIDGRDKPDLALPMYPVIDGDALVLSIAAASVVAKVARDRLMRRLDLCCPGYGFASHVGYGTAAHRSALDSRGPSRYHRMTFAPIAQRILPLESAMALEFIESE